MGTLIHNAKYIYESPDNGDTVYARLEGSTERKLIGISVKKQKDLDYLKQTEIWLDVLKEAENNPSLSAAVEQVMILYKLIKN